MGFRGHAQELLFSGHSLFSVRYPNVRARISAVVEIERRSHGRERQSLDHYQFHASSHRMAASIEQRRQKRGKQLRLARV